MTPVEFMHRKNAIVKELTGLTLIPEDQIKEVPAERLYLDSDAGICPYCQTYDTFSCDGCPMDTAKNNCESVGSTYMEVYRYFDEKGMHLHTTPAILNLIEEYNKQFEE